MCNSVKEERSYYHDMLLKYSEPSAASGTFTAGWGAGPPLLGRGGAEVGLRLEEGRHLLERAEEPSSPGRMFTKLWHEKTGPVKGGVRSPCLPACGVPGAGREMILESELQPVVRAMSPQVREMGFCGLNETC